MTWPPSADFARQDFDTYLFSFDDSIAAGRDMPPQMPGQPSIFILLRCQYAIYQRLDADDMPLS